MKTKKPNSYQKLKQKYEKRINELLRDLRVLTCTKNKSEILEVKTRWNVMFRNEEILFDGDNNLKGNGILSQILNAENNTFDILDDKKNIALKEVMKDLECKKEENNYKILDHGNWKTPEEIIEEFGDDLTEEQRNQLILKGRSDR